MKTPRKNILRNASALLAVTALAAVPAHAALPAIDTFEDYMAGSNIHGQSGGTGWNGAWEVRNTHNGSNPSAGTAFVSATSITYNHGGVTLGGGNSLELTNSSAGTQRNVFGALDTSGDDFYVSLIFQYTGAVFVGFQAKDDFVDVFNDSTSIVNTTHYAAARVDNGEGNKSALTAGTTYFMVVQYTGWTEANPQYTTVNVWINPNTGDQSESSISSTYTDSTPADGGGSSGFLGLFVRTTSFESGDSFLLDDLRVGTDWASVTAIPEPGTTAVAASAAVLLCALFNRRRRA